MIKTATDDKGITRFSDDSENLPGPMLAAVHAAMSAGLTEFTTPTPEDDQKRIDWRVRNWVTNSGGKLAAFRVAYKESFAQFEVIGPEINLAVPPELNRRVETLSTALPLPPRNIRQNSLKDPQQRGV